MNRPAALLAWVTATMVLALVMGTGIVTQLNAHDGEVSPDVIHSCVNYKSGEIKIADADDPCRGNNSALDWNGAAGGAGGFYSYSLQTESCDAGTSTCTATCPVGHKVLGGGYEHTPGRLTPLLQRNGPDGDNVWRVTTRLGNSFPTEVTIYATCADTN